MQSCELKSSPPLPSSGDLGMLLRLLNTNLEIENNTYTDSFKYKDDSDGLSSVEWHPKCLVQTAKRLMIIQPLLILVIGIVSEQLVVAKCPTFNTGETLP